MCSLSCSRHIGPRIDKNYRRLILIFICGWLFFVKKVFSVNFLAIFLLKRKKNVTSEIPCTVFQHKSLFSLGVFKRFLQILEAMSLAKKQPKKIGRNCIYTCTKSFTSAKSIGYEQTLIS